MRKLHSFVPVSSSTIEVRFYSASDVFKKEKITLAKNDLPPESRVPESITGIVTCLHDGIWWLACVLEVTQEVRLAFLHPHGPSNSFRYPELQDIHTVPIENIIFNFSRSKDENPSCIYIDYALTKKEISSASEKLCSVVSPK